MLPRLRGSASLVRYAGRRRDAVSIRGRRSTRHGRAPEEIRALRSGAASGQDAAHAVSTSGCGTMPAAMDPDKPGTFDFLGFTIHWGKKLPWQMGREDANGSRPLPTSARKRLSVVQGQPPCSAGDAAEEESLDRSSGSHYGYYNRRGNPRRRVWDFLYRVVCAWWHLVASPAHSADSPRGRCGDCSGRYPTAVPVSPHKSQ